MNNLRNFPPVTLGIFQSTLLQEERRPYVMIYDKYKLFQSTLLQEERHKLPGLSVMNRYISIHAPTRGATGISKTTLNDIEFQSTLLQEERQLPLFRLFSGSGYFNPRSYKRSDQTACDGIHNSGRFQSTLLQEERQSLTLLALNWTIFQSTLLQEERQEQGLLLRLPISISIHAPTRGATTKTEM